MHYYHGDRVKLVKSGTFMSVVEYLDKWLHLPQRLPYFKFKFKGCQLTLEPGRQIKVMTSEIITVVP